MPSQSANGQPRANEKIVVAYKLKGDLPVDWTVSTLNTYLGVDVDDTTHLKIETGMTWAPTAVESTADTEGLIVVLENDVAGNMNIINQTPEDAIALFAAFNNVNCDVVMLFGDPDTITVGSPVLVVEEGMRIAVVQNVVPGMADSYADGTDYKIVTTLKKKIGAIDRIAEFHTVIADA